MRITRTAGRTTRASPRCLPTSSSTTRSACRFRAPTANAIPRSIATSVRPASPTTHIAARPGRATADPARAGFAAPAGTTFRHDHRRTVSESAAIAALTGSDPAAYAAAVSGRAVQHPGRFNDSLVRIPVADEHRTAGSEQERLALTGALQWKPTETTNIGLDMVYSKFDQKSDVNQIQSVGLNRNNTNANFNAADCRRRRANRRGTLPRPAPARPRCRSAKRSIAAAPRRCRAACSPGSARRASAPIRTTSIPTTTTTTRCRRVIRRAAVTRPTACTSATASSAGRASMCSRRTCLRRGQCRLPRAAQRRLALGHRLLVLHDAVPAGFVEPAAGHRRSAEGGRAVRQVHVRPTTTRPSWSNSIAWIRPRPSSTTNAPTAPCRRSAMASISPTPTTGAW